MTPEAHSGGTDVGPWTILARLIRPQGRHGEILAEILTDFPERFADRKRLFLIASEAGPGSVREINLENYWLHKGRIVLKFAGVDSIGDAELLRGLSVAIPMSERAELTDGSVYISDLVGSTVFDLNSTLVGVVEDFDRGAGLLAVKTANGGEVLIPFVEAYLVKIDLAAKRIEMRLPAGLLEINAPLSNEERRALEASRENE
jgi:16S rRNA processing protein RimM